MAELKHDTRSQISTAPLYQIDDVTFWGRMEPEEIDPHETDRLHVVKGSDRLDRLAAQYYGNPYMRWVIMRANGMRLEPNDLIPGEEIRIPTFERLKEEGKIPD